ncbi:hypothetical protein IFM89_022560 [Coptis chinensis]|uniref:Dolichyl-diphosphooligosaccharide--protein glycosyltransferase subunit 1 n=1 Tax=Coptis chinensis TaxID=261450 RepID=A0A835HGK4_9MAGN|nr:hypothetical protein IFM89_022560 [Coptis chinensis]
MTVVTVVESIWNYLLKLCEKDLYRLILLWKICDLYSYHVKSELQIEPRYPLFGGWKATFVIGYGLPLQDFLFESSDGRRYLNFSFGCPLVDTVVEKLILKVVLPEGSKNASAVVPFAVEQHLEVILSSILPYGTSYSYLDVVGRNVVVLEKKNVVPEHNTPFQYQTSLMDDAVDRFRAVLCRHPTEL